MSKKQALEAVTSNLHNAGALPSIIVTLKVLFGRPRVIYKTLIKQVRNAPTVKVEKLETLVTYAMRVKSLCDTMSMAKMDDYLTFLPYIALQLR